MHEDDIIDEAAWRAFGAGIADRLADLPAGGRLRIGREHAGDADTAHPCVEVRSVRDCLVVLLPAGGPALEVPDDLGFGDAAGGRRRRAVLPSAYADKAASIVVRVLREVFGVVHPVFLTGDVPAVESVLSESRVRGVTPQRPAVLEWMVRVLRVIVDDAVAVGPGHVVSVSLGRSPFIVRYDEHSASIHLFGSLVADISRPDAAEEIVQSLNQQDLGAHFHIHDDTIVAAHTLPLDGLSELHLLEAVKRFGRAVERQVGLLARLSGGRSLDEGEPAATEAPWDDGPDALDDREGGAAGWADADPDPRDQAVYLRLFRLNALQPQGLKPKQALTLVDGDVALLGRLIARAEEEVQGWGRLRDGLPLDPWAPEEHVPDSDAYEAARVETERLRRCLHRAVWRAEPL